MKRENAKPAWTPNPFPRKNPFQSARRILSEGFKFRPSRLPFFSRSSYVADTPFASTLCSLPIFFVPFFHHFHSLGVLAKVMRGMREGRRGRCRSSTFANFNSRNLCPAECFGGGEMCERTGICVWTGDVWVCVRVCVWPVCGTALILWTHVFGKITLSIGSLNDYFSNVCEN